MLSCAKMNGNGNDFIVFDNRRLQFGPRRLAGLALLLCRRRESLGADGLLVLEHAETGHFAMRLFNRDGSEGEMCGNGARCIARYAWEKGIAPQEMTFQTLAGPQKAWVEPPQVQLAMGKIDLSDILLEEKLGLNGREWHYSFLTAGVPHAVVFPEDPALLEREDEIRDLGCLLRHRTDLFPGGTNVNFVVPEKESLRVLTYERGVEDLTLSCGTGSTASAIVSRLLGHCGDETDVHNPGGTNHVSLEFKPDQTVRPFLTGRAALVAWAEIPEETLYDSGEHLIPPLP